MYTKEVKVTYDKVTITIRIDSEVPISEEESRYQAAKIFEQELAGIDRIFGYVINLT